MASFKNILVATDTRLDDRTIVDEAARRELAAIKAIAMQTTRTMPLPGSTCKNRANGCCRLSIGYTVAVFGFDSFRFSMIH